MTSSVSGTYIPTIPGITGVLGAISATAAYANLSATGTTKELALVAKAPQVATETAYFKSAVSKMKTVNDLLADPRALNYLLTSFGLGSSTGQMGIIKQVLTQDPTASGSLVNQLAETKWKTMATTLQTFATGLNTIKGTTTTQTFGVQSFSNEYLQVQSQNSTTYNVGGAAQSLSSTQNLYTNNLAGLTVSAGGVLQTTEGYNVMGLKLDNQGNIQPPAGANLVDSTSSILDSNGASQAISQSFSNEGNNNWQWTVKDSSGNILSQQSLALTLNPDGTLNTINGVAATNADGSSNTTQNVTLDWSDGTTTSQAFDLGQAFTAGFNQYQTDADLRSVQVNWFDNGNTPSTTVTPFASLNSAQPVADPNTYTDVESVQTDDAASTFAAVTQTLTKNSDGTWNWNVTNSDGTSLYSQDNMALTFDSSGTLTAVNGNTNTAPSVNLTWSDGGTTSQSFDLSKVFQRSDFSQTASIVDNIGTSHNVRLDYTKTDDGANTWQVKVWNEDTNTLASTVDFSFNADGSVQSVGTYNAQTGQIADSNNNPNATSQNIQIDWGSGYGSSTLSLDLSNLSDLSSTNIENQTTQTDSVKLGARQSVAIGQDGTVSATYAKADGSGNVTLNLYRLAVNKFSGSGGLNQYGSSSYYTANSLSGTDTIQPLGTDKDALGNTVSGEAGQLLSTPTTTQSANMIDTITSGYNNYVYQEALGQENEALRYATYFKQNASSITSIDQLLGDGPARNLVSTVFGIPQQVAIQDINTQEQIFSRKIDITQLQNPKYVDSLIQRFLAVSDASSPTGSGTTASNPLSALFAGTATNAATLLSTVTSNINILA